MTTQPDTFDTLSTQMRQQLADRRLFEHATEYVRDYLEHVTTMDAFPSPESRALLDRLDEPMPAGPASPDDSLTLLHEVGSPNTVAQSGGRNFGIVNGGVAPIGLAGHRLGPEQRAVSHVPDRVAPGRHLRTLDRRSAGPAHRQRRRPGQWLVHRDPVRPGERPRRPAAAPGLGRVATRSDQLCDLANHAHAWV